jgi:hypothetical protein
VGNYRDTNEQGTLRGWKYGSSGANVCNMTSVTMALVSIAGEATVRAKMIGLLRDKGIHSGAQVAIGDNFVDLAPALDNPAVAPRIKLIDLVTAVAIGPRGDRGLVTEASTIARVARDTGLATAKEEGGPIHLDDARVRARAAAMLAEGKRVVAGTVNHYVYLIAVRDDGVVVHDPAGARVVPHLTGPIFLHPRGVEGIAREWSAADATRRETARRRVSSNPAAAAVVAGLTAIDALPTRPEKTAALRKLAADHPGTIETGALNFYATSEFKANDLRLRVTLTAV